MKTNRFIWAAALLAGVLAASDIPSFAQVEGRASLYTSVPGAWAGAIGASITQLPASALPTGSCLSLLKNDLSSPDLRLHLAPIVMTLESQNVTPEAFSGMAPEAQRALLESAAVKTQETVQQEATALTQQANQEVSPELVAKLYVLGQASGDYLPASEITHLAKVYVQAHTQLSEAQRARLDAKIRDIAQGLQGKSPVKSLPGEKNAGAIQSGPADPQSFARQHARLSPHTPSLSGPATPAVAGERPTSSEDLARAKSQLKALREQHDLLLHSGRALSSLAPEYRGGAAEARAVAYQQGRALEPQITQKQQAIAQMEAAIRQEHRQLRDKLRGLLKEKASLRVLVDHPYEFAAAEFHGNAAEVRSRAYEDMGRLDPKITAAQSDILALEKKFPFLAPVKNALRAVRNFLKPAPPQTK